MTVRELAQKLDSLPEHVKDLEVVAASSATGVLLMIDRVGTHDIHGKGRFVFLLPEVQKKRRLV